MWPFVPSAQLARQEVAGGLVDQQFLLLGGDPGEGILDCAAKGSGFGGVEHFNFARGRAILCLGEIPFLKVGQAFAKHFALVSSSLAPFPFPVGGNDQEWMNIGKRVVAFRDKMQGFAARWEELKPKSASSGDPKLITSRLEDFSFFLEDLAMEAEKIKLDCEHFSIEEPHFPTLTEVSNDIQQTKGHKYQQAFDDLVFAVPGPHR